MNKNQQAIEQIHCPQCDAGVKEEIAISDLNEKLGKDRFIYYKCLKCGFIFLEPVPTDLGRFYPSNYHAIPQDLEDFHHSFDFEKHKLDLVEKYSKGRRLLEVGPSFGAFSYLAKSRGFDVQAVELDPTCRTFLREKIGIRVRDETDVVAALDSGEKYDAVCFWHSLEHLPNLWRSVDVLWKAVSTDGSVFISTPNPESFQYGFFGKYWVHVDAPRHVALIPFHVLQKRLESTGFETKHFTTNDRGAKDCNALGWQYSLNHVIGTDKSTHIVRRAGDMLGKLFSRAEIKEGRGSTYTAVFSRK